MNSFFSLVIAHRNEGYLLNIMLDSIYNNIKYPNFEIIIVDDESDNVSDLDFLETHFLSDKIKLIKSTKVGPANARNLWASYAKWDRLFFLDAHIYFEEDPFPKILNEVISNSSIDAIQLSITDMTDKNVKIGTYLRKRDFNAIRNNLDFDKNFAEVPKLASGWFLIKKEVFDYLWWFNKNMESWGGEDSDISVRLWLCGFRWVFYCNTKIAHFFKPKHDKRRVKTDLMVYNKLQQLHTLIQNPARKELILSEIQKSHPDVFELANTNLNNNKNFWIRQQEQKRKFIYNDDRYFEKFKNYYEHMLLK